MSDTMNQTVNRHPKRRKSIVIICVIVAIILCALGAVAAKKFSQRNDNPSDSSDSQAIESTTDDTSSSQEDTEETSSESTTPTETEETATNSETEPTISTEEYEEGIHAIQPGVEFAHFTSKATITPSGDALLDKARSLAASYDYDTAIELLSQTEGYEDNQSYQDAVAEFEEAKSQTTRFATNNNITHIFFHTLVADPTIAFDETITGTKAAQYNEVMTTINEFVSMMEELYAKGYVLVSLHQIAEIQIQEDGSEKMVYNDIYLPEGKTPFVLSVDDVCYYEYMTGHGYASRLIVKEDGSVVNEMELSDGSTVEGAFDVLPILEEFCKLHPDFSYQGARGILALTGYNGVFGYRTSDYWYAENCDYYEATEKHEEYKKTQVTYPNLNIEQDKETAKQVAQAIRDLGWELASHSWGHRYYGSIDIADFYWDADMWEREVETIIGDTDIIIFAFGNDIGSWRGYEDDNERYQYLKSLGFDYYCNVDSNEYFLQKGTAYLRQGRRNLDGQRMWEAIKADNGVEGYKNRLSDLFDDVSAIIDPLRPELAQ